MPSPLGTLVIEEQQEWESFITQRFGREAWLYYISPSDSDRRGYRFDDKIAKVQRWRDTNQGGEKTRQELKDEYATILYLQEHSKEKLNASYERTADWEILICDFLDGMPFDDVWRSAGLWQKMLLIQKIVLSMQHLNRLGVYHGDIVSNNLIVTENRSVRLVDFGDATLMSPASATRHEWQHFLFGRHGLLARNARRLAQRVFPFSQGLYRRWKMQQVRPFTFQDNSSEEMRLLEDAWRQSARWHTAEGGWHAYSSFTVAGHHLPGQRPWLLRWHHIAKHVSFQGKRVLDLGCNTGLLGSFAMLYGATDYLGLDTEEPLVGAARKIAAAFGVQAQFEVANIDTVDAEDGRYTGWDLVVAMSIYEWVSDKERLLSLIGSANEVLYEGHDSLEVELGRLSRAGFQNVQIVAVSERHRPILYGVKASAQNGQQMSSDLVSSARA